MIEKLSSFLRDLSRICGEILTSLFVVIVVMLSVLIGISEHLATVFESWFLALGFQSVVLVASVNADILPSIKLSDGIKLSVLPFILSLFILWFLFLSFNGIEYVNKEDWMQMTISITKALAISTAELMFATIFTLRWQADKRDRNKDSKATIVKLD